MIPSKYVQVAARIHEEYLTKHISNGYRFPKMAENPLSMG